MHWVKTLSSASLRAEARWDGVAGCLRIKHSWPAEEDFLNGFFLRHFDLDQNQKKTSQPQADFDPKSEPNNICRIKKWSASQNAAWLLEDPVPEDWRDGRSRLIELFHPDWEAPILAAHLVTQTPADRSLPPLEMRLGSTRGTNALLERKGARVALLVNAGLEDHLFIHDQRRSDLFAKNPSRPAPFYDRVMGLPIRRDSHGAKTGENDWEEVGRRIEQIKGQGVESVAVCLMHSYAWDEDEQALLAMLKEMGMKNISISSQCAPFIKWIPRCETTVINAYIEPVLKDYLDRIEGELEEGSRFWIMTSAGGLVTRRAFQAKDGLLSGPAGGVVAVASLSTQTGGKKLIGFDMGGTSADVCRFDGALDYRFECRVGDSRALATALKIETVAAGGGSICRFDGERLLVGPQSAGAAPGPACYGAGGPLTVTDVQLLMGRLDADRFGIPIRMELAEAALDRLREEISQSAFETPSREALLQGLLDIANERMAETIRKISVREGFDPADYALVAFGGAGGQTVCSLADRLGMTQILAPKEAGLFSARGIRDASIERFAEAQYLRLWRDWTDADFSQEMQSLIEVALTKLGEETEDAAASLSAIFEIRYFGQGQTQSLRRDLELELTQLALDFPTLRTDFERLYQEVFGYLPEGKELELVSVRVVAASAGYESELESFELDPNWKVESVPFTKRPALSEGKWDLAMTVNREDIQPGARLKGPCLISDAFNAIWVDASWTASMGDQGTLKLEKSARKDSAQSGAHENLDLIQQELFASRFRGLAESMGSALERTAISTNVKERLDFSCALLDADGELIINAPHIPVHLGALGQCVRSIPNRLELRPGDCIITNHPAYGGSHLPDVTLITPIFGSDQNLLGYVANRAHHAEIGGIRPGSMPPGANRLEQEGIAIAPTFLFQTGQAKYEEIRSLLLSGPYPTRSVEDNLADLRAQNAANRLGERLFLQIVEEFGEGKTLQAMQGLKDLSRQALLRRLEKWPEGHKSSKQTLDDGSVIQLSITKNSEDQKLVVDFTGTSPQHSGNLNATPAIVISAILYVLRVWVDEPIPLNEGALSVVDLILPAGCFLNPNFTGDPKDFPAVVGGNVETSQRIVDALWEVLELGALSQGTMNNFVFGSAKGSHYETIGGGAGAVDGENGASGVHVHMTNTGITDPEILETRFPVLLEAFKLRSGSGGAGRWKGGDGLIRRVRFLVPMSVSLLTQRRVSGPNGTAGGASGAPGKQLWIHPDGAVQELPSMASIDVEQESRIEIQTPGGGGYGVAGIG